MSHRIPKLNSLIKKHVAEIISHKLSLKPEIIFTITKVDTAKDLSYADVFISVLPEKEYNYLLKTLRKEIYFIQKQLNQKMSIKKFPRLRFHLDTTEAQADKIEKILQRLEND